MTEQTGWDKFLGNPAAAAYHDLPEQKKANVQVEYFENKVMPNLQQEADSTGQPLDPGRVKGAFKAFFSKYPLKSGVEPEYVPQAMRQIIKEDLRKIKPPEADPDRGVGHTGFQFSYNMADTREEKEAVFERYKMHKGDVFQMEDGEYALNPTGMEKLGLKHHGQPTAIKSKGTMFGASAGTRGALEAAKIAPEVAASVLTGPFGASRAMLATGGAGIAGESLEEMIEASRGLSREDKLPVGMRAGKRGLMSGLMEGGIRSVQPLARKALLGPQAQKQGWNLGFRKTPAHESPLDPANPSIGRSMQPEAIERTEKALGQGIVPMISRAAETGGSGPASLVGSGQEVLNRVFGNYNLLENTQVATKLAGHFLERATKKTARPYTENLGEATLIQGMGRKAEGTAADLAKTVRQSYTEADTIVNQSVKQLEDQYPGGAWDFEKLGPIIKDHKKAFSDEMTKKASFLNYPKAKELVIPTGQMTDIIKLWKTEFPEGGAFMSPEMREYVAAVDALTIKESVKKPLGFGVDLAPKVAKGPSSKKISFQQLQTLRSQFSAASYDSGLTKSVGQYRAGQMKSTMDGMMDEAIRTGNLDKNLKNKLLAFNESYTTGMAKYDDQLILSMAKQGKDRVPLNQLTDRILSMDRITAKKLHTILPTQDWREMGSHMFAEIAERSKNVATEQIDPTLMLQHMKTLKMNKTHGLLFESKQAASIQKSLKELESRGYEGDLSGLLQRNTDVSAVLQRAIKEQDALESYWSGNFMKELQKADPSKAYQWAASHPNHAREMMEFIGKDEAMAGQARKVFLDRMFAKVASNSKDTVGQVLDGKVLQKGVKHFEELGVTTGGNPGQIILGKQLWSDLKGLGEAFRSTEYEAGGAIGAAAQGMKFLLSPLQMLPTAAKKKVIHTLLANPSVVRYMSTGLKEGIGGQFGTANRLKLGTFFRVVAQGIRASAEKAGVEIPFQSEEVDLNDSQVFQELMK